MSNINRRMLQLFRYKQDLFVDIEVEYGLLRIREPKPEKIRKIAPRQNEVMELSKDIKEE